MPDIPRTAQDDLYHHEPKPIPLNLQVIEMIGCTLEDPDEWIGIWVNGEQVASRFHELRINGRNFGSVVQRVLVEPMDDRYPEHPLRKVTIEFVATHVKVTE